MNIFDAIRQFKQLAEVTQSLKEELRSSVERLEGERVTVVVNGLGELVELELKPESCKELESELKELINEAQRRARERVKEAAKEKLGGLDLGF
ncbi:MAG: hypothetical protein GXO03_00195 [Aquificae bacterium]|nr:hypothetical protein [Aquificota bacterium]